MPRLRAQATLHNPQGAADYALRSVPSR